LGTTRNTSLLMSGVTTAFAGPVTDAAAAPIALSGQPVEASEPNNVAGICVAAIGTVIAACRAKGRSGCSTESQWDRAERRRRRQPHLAGHARHCVRDIEKVVVWTRSSATLANFRAGIQSLGIPVEPATIVCTLTPSRAPVVFGAWLRPGQHVNAVGAPPRPDHREVDS
jgi:hypothetical protein